MAKLILTGLTMKQAETLASWFEGAGEQQTDIWFESTGVTPPITHVGAKDWLVINKAKQTVTMKCWTPQDPE